MSRAVYTSTKLSDAKALCAKNAIDITAIETLPSGGTRVVLKSAEAAEKMRKAFARTLLANDVLRFPTGARARLPAAR